MPGRLVSSILAMLFPPPPLRPISELEVGKLATVRGKVVPRDLLESPLTGDRCVYCLYTLEQWHEATSPQIAGDGFWRLIERDEVIAEFYLQDEGVRVIVAPHQAQVVRASGPPMSEVEYGILGRRARQLLIEPGADIEVRGVVVRVDDLFDDGRDYRALPTRLMLAAPEGGRLEIKVL